MTDYLLERYERGISGNYKPVRGIFGYSDVDGGGGGGAAGERTVRYAWRRTRPDDDRGGRGAGVSCSAEYYRNPLVFHRPLHFFPDVLYAVLSSMAFCSAPLMHPAPAPRHSRTVFLLLPIQFHAGTRLP